MLPHLGKLIYHARSWLDGRPRVLESVRRYLSLAAELYREVQENYRVMVSHSSAWAGAVLELLLSLDIVQVRVRLPNGKFAAKAVLLPTHPLHLWRNERLSTLLRGLAQSTSLGENDRKLLRKELELVKLLKDPRYRGGQKLSAVDASIYATSQHADRLRAALSFGDTRKEDEVQEQVASGRLRLHIEESCLTSEPELHDIVEMIRKRPCHVAAIFDESTIRLRSRGARKNLPMSPFCVRYEIQIDQHLGNIELRPQPGESPFSEFLLLMNELEGHQRDATPHAYADAESLAKTTDIILRGERPAASWLFLADRALPPEAGMESVRIWERRSGMRDTFLATRDFNALARLIRPAFARCNLTVTPEHMTRLLHKGARLLGSGLLEIIKRQDGSPDTKKVTGFVGLLLAAWDFQRRHPGALVMSVDHPLARLWLRTGSQISGERCDLLVLWRDPANGEFSMIAAEVKTSDGDHLNNESTRHAEAVTQIQHTLEALQDGLAAAASAQSSPLSIPRCEMLKHTLVRAALARSGDAAMDRNNRKRYGAWLAALFPQEDKPTPTVQLSGCVVSVMLRRATAGGVEEKLASEPWPLLHRTLGEQDVEELLAWEVDTKTVPIPSVAENEGDIKNEVIPVNPPAKPVATVATQSWTPKQPIPSATGTTNSATPAAHPAHSDKQWPPAVNQLGMIGQYREVDLLVKQAVFAKTMGQRFSDKLLVGPAGVGKSTLARKIGELLLNREPVFCNGADLRKPADLLERLRREGLVPDDSTGGTLAIAPSLVFIDEVHGIGILAATTLLSAMDDRRTTTIDGRLYDFNPVIFLLATTDQGKLSEAFQSRPDKTSLRPYALHELAGIVWLHGKECLDGSELPKESCYEIAARTRCSPRRSVRDLSEILRPHFFHLATETQSEVPTLRQVAELMTRDNIAAFYQGQGIDGNGLDDLAWRYLNYLKLHITASEATLMQGLGLADRRDFNEATEYLARLGLIETSSGGRRLTRDGTKYLNSNPPPDLRDRISRAM
ncbi:MAG: AAA family ATPase [Candidatus Methylumidiphilus sp.]